MITALGDVPFGCRQRLNALYGHEVSGWLDQVPFVLTEAAHEWKLGPRRFHDAGHASTVALAHTSDGEQVVMKAWFERDRYLHEMAALQHWEPVNGHVVRARDDARAVAVLTLVGGQPGGAPTPPDHVDRVAAALARLHDHCVPDIEFPPLTCYRRGTVEPRVRRRLRLYGDGVPHRCLNLGVNAAPVPTRDDPVLLHADLYRENVAVDTHGQPVFLDPLPMLGDPAFDWAFFVVYFDLAADPVYRLRAASAASGIHVQALLPWCLWLCLDGLLYYHEAVDGREPRMVDVMIALADEFGIS